MVEDALHTVNASESRKTAKREGYDLIKNFQCENHNFASVEFDYWKRTYFYFTRCTGKRNFFSCVLRKKLVCIFLHVVIFICLHDILQCGVKLKYARSTS